MNIVNDIVKILDSYLDFETVGFFNENMLLNEDVVKIKLLLSQVDDKKNTYDQALKIVCNRYSTDQKD